MKMTRSLSLILGVVLGGLTALPAAAQNVQYVEPAKPYSSSPFLQNLQPRKTDLGRGTLRVPMISWAADGVTVFANDGQKANPRSALAKSVGLPVTLELVDDFDQQVANYVTGKSPFLRGTVGMINLASGALAQIDPGLKPVVILQLSWSTGADGFVAKGIDDLADLKGKTIVVQKNGPHTDLVQTLLEDAGLQPEDVTLKYVSEITYNEKVAADGRAHDPASAFREDPSIDGAACIYPDILTLTAGGNTGTGAEDSVKGARPVLSTRTASRVIADVYAVRADFLRENRAAVHGFVLEHLRAQKHFQGEIANIAARNKADKNRTASFKETCKPLAGIFLQDEGAVNDYIAWVGLDLEIAGLEGNRDFFGNARNPIGFVASSARAINYYEATGLVSDGMAPDTVGWDYSGEFANILQGGGGNNNPIAAEAPIPKAKVFGSTQQVRAAAESGDASELFTYTFQFPANTSEIKWQNHKGIFDTLHEKVSRYGGAVVQLRGHSDNFFYNFVQAKRKSGADTYKQRVPGTNQFQEKPLPQIEQIIGSANRLSYDRAFSVKRAYAQYLRESLSLTSDEIDLSRFDVKGMGIGDPVNAAPRTPEERAANMRGQMVIFAVESEIPLDFGMDDLQ